MKHLSFLFCLSLVAIPCLNSNHKPISPAEKFSKDFSERSKKFDEEWEKSHKDFSERSDKFDKEFSERSKKFDEEWEKSNKDFSERSDKFNEEFFGLFKKFDEEQKKSNRTFWIFATAIFLIFIAVLIIAYKQTNRALDIFSRWVDKKDDKK